MTNSGLGQSGWIMPGPAVGPAPGYVFVGFWRRFWAFLLDALIVGIPAWILLTPIFLNSVSASDLDALSRGMFTIDPTTGQLVSDPAALAAYDAAISAVTPLILFLGAVFLLIQMLYFAGLWSRRGASFGQQMLGVQVRNERDGTRISFVRGCLRYLGYIVSTWVVYLGFIWVAIDSRKQGWHDKIAGTVAIRRIG